MDVKMCLGMWKDITVVNSSVSRLKSSLSLLVVGLVCSMLSAKTMHLTSLVA